MRRFEHLRAQPRKTPLNKTCGGSSICEHNCIRSLCLRSDERGASIRASACSAWPEKEDPIRSNLFFFLSVVDIFFLVRQAYGHGAVDEKRAMSSERVIFSLHIVLTVSVGSMLIRSKRVQAMRRIDPLLYLQAQSPKKQVQAMRRVGIYEHNGMLMLVQLVCVS